MKSLTSLLTLWFLVSNLCAPFVLPVYAQTILPIVFVPGFGSSMNASALASLDIHHTYSNGWEFWPSLSESYFRFFHLLDQASIPYEVAYYDWRLPASESVDRYLKVAIDKAKQRYHVNSVNLVAHSFGGLLARSYIQGKSYRGDVARLITLGTPQYGTPLAYLAWEGGVLPPDWSRAAYLVHYYQLLLASQYQSVSFVGALRRFVPGLQDLLPIYDALIRNKARVSSAALYTHNTFLTDLNHMATSTLKKVGYMQVVSNSIGTLYQVGVGAANPNSETWHDGLARPGDNRISLGDDTVPLVSAQLSGFTSIMQPGHHIDLPVTAIQTLVKQLYPSLHIASPNIQSDSVGELGGRMGIVTGAQSLQIWLHGVDCVQLSNCQIQTQDLSTVLSFPDYESSLRMAIRGKPGGTVTLWLGGKSLLTVLLDKKGEWQQTVALEPG